MYSLSREEFKGLTDKQSGFCVSMFMPTYRTGAESQQNQIRFKNMLRNTEDKLLACNLRAPEIKTLLEPAQALAGNVLFWRRQSDGLAIFLSGGRFRSYCLPILFDGLILVSDRFHIKPLLPLLHGEERFYILALSQNSVRFLEGTKYSVREVEVEGLPRSLTEALSYGEPEKQIRFRTGMSGGGERGAMVSGHGADIEDTKDNILKYFRQIDRVLRSFLKDERAPLVLAGVDYLFPIYKGANTYPFLLEGGVAGNPEGMSNRKPSILRPRVSRIHSTRPLNSSACSRWWFSLKGGSANYGGAIRYEQNHETLAAGMESENRNHPAFHQYELLLLCAEGNQSGRRGHA